MYTQTNRLDPAEDVCGQQSCPLHCPLFFWWYTLWAGNSLTISILTLSKSPTCCQPLCRAAIWHEVWNYVQKNCHTTRRVHLHPQYIWSHYSPQYTNAHSTFSGTVQSDVSLACLQKKTRSQNTEQNVMRKVTSLITAHCHTSQTFHVTQIPTARWTKTSLLTYLPTTYPPTSLPT